MSAAAPHATVVRDSVVTREAVSRVLRDLDWPARSADLLDQARRRRPHPGVIRMLSGLPNGVYAGPNQVCRALFGPFGHAHPNP